SRSTICVLCLSFGLTAKRATPTIFSYGPASPNDLPSAKGSRDTTVSAVTSAEASEGRKRHNNAGRERRMAEFLDVRSGGPSRLRLRTPFNKRLHARPLFSLEGIAKKSANPCKPLLNADVDDWDSNGLLHHGAGGEHSSMTWPSGSV